MKRLITLMLMLWCITPAYCQVHEVCKGCQFVSISEAISASEQCDTIIVHEGFYRESKIIIDKGLTLMAKGNAIVESKDGNEIFIIKADYVTIEGFQLQNIAVSHVEDRAAIRIVESRFFTIVNNKLVNTFFGIYLQNSSQGEVSRNHIQGVAKSEATSGNAIHLWYCERVVLLDNFVAGHRDGIYFEFVNNSLISGNHSERNVRYGLHFMFSNDNAYYYNVFTKNGAGVAVMYSRRINMYNNTFSKNWGPSSYGLLLKEIHDSFILNNHFTENTIGIFAETSNRLLYKNNVFSQNGWALKVTGGCQKNSLVGNDFFGNSFDVSVHTTGEDNLYDGNFWSDYSGYDLDRDGVGDVPHRPMKLFSFVVSKTPEAIILLRSLFVDILNFSEKVSPLFTPASVIDNKPRMKPVFEP